MEQLVTRAGELFQVADRRGDFVPEERACGLFARDTRFLSRFELLVDGRKPEALGADSGANCLLRVCGQAGGAGLGVERRRVIHGGVMYERITLTNYRPEAQRPRLELRYGSDFADIFEVRGAGRSRRGALLPAEIGGTHVTLGYRGLDEILRQTRLVFGGAPGTLTGDRAVWDLHLAPRGSATVEVAVIPAASGGFAVPVGFAAALALEQAEYAAWCRQLPAIESDDTLFNEMINRSVLDLAVLLSDSGHGPFPVAGIPWFVVPFGRDSLITALEALLVAPDLARGTLRTLAALQGTEVNAWRQEEPGKIPHELRCGEMANLDEIPFRRYYGTVDATPLFLVLVGEYYDWTGDLELVRELLPNIRAALAWLERHGGTYLTFQADRGLGLAVQSWKDSADSLTHRDGRPAASPVAVSEVQGYAYDARRRLAPLLELLGECELAAQVRQAAEQLKARFNADFWMADRQYPAIALAGDGEQVGTVSSDIGHCLWSGIIEDAKAEPAARRLVGPELFSGWGIRTLSSAESSYNPMSYHNGSVWPHDTALCILGLKRYGFDREANQVIAGLTRAASYYPYFRLPELFCGYAAGDGAPVDYPVACSPQAWAAAAPFAMTQAILGLQPDAASGVLRLRPCLPPFMHRLTVRGLRVGQAVVDIEVTGEATAATVREGALQMIVEDPSR